MSTDPGAPAPPSPDPAPVAGDAWEHRDDLVAYARRLLGTHGEMAEDVVQEAYLRLHECAATGAPVDEARPWLFRVARNLALDERRRSRRGDDVLSSLGVVSPGPRGPLEVLQAREEAREALEGLEALPPRERRTVILEQAGLAPPAIARRMHTTTNAVHQSLFRARRRMRDARGAALGLLPLPLIRLMVRAAGSPTLDRLPALTPGSGGRLAGGAGLAGLVAAAVIGGGGVADRPVVPPPAAPAHAAAAPVAPGDAVAAAASGVSAPAPMPASRPPIAGAGRPRTDSGAAVLAGVREAPSRRAGRAAEAVGLPDDDGPLHRTPTSGGDDADPGEGRDRGERAGGDDADRGGEPAGRRAEGRSRRGEGDDHADAGGSGTARGGRRGRDDGEDDGSLLASGGGVPGAGSGEARGPVPGGAAEQPSAVADPEPQPQPQTPPVAPEPAAGQSDPATAGAGAEAQTGSGPPAPGPVDPS